MAMVEIPIPEDGDGERSKEVEEDRLSSLPDALLVSIISLLPIESAATTSVLSHRWRHLWTQLTRLRFSCRDSPIIWGRFDNPKRADKLSPIIDHIFRQLTSPQILTFHFHVLFNPAKDQRESSYSCFTSWVRQICARNVEEIEVSLGDSSRSLILLPTCVFETQSLVVLKLYGWFSYNLPDSGTINLPNLKILKIELRDQDLELMGLLFKSCPLLEDLQLNAYCYEDDQFVDISAQCLKRLAIFWRDHPKSFQFRIDAPQLECFRIVTSCSRARCFVIVSDLSCLLKAEILVSGNPKSYYVDGMSKLLRGISSVKSLDLDSGVFNCLYYPHDGDIVFPVLHNLTHLVISTSDRDGWSGLLPFLGCCPNLESLVLSHDFSFCDTKHMRWTIPDSVPICLLNKLKRMEIEKFQGCKKELDFLGYFLSNGDVLEQLLLCKFDYYGNGKSRYGMKFCEKLFSCPRSSVSCEIEVTGEYVSASSKGSNK